MSEMTETQMDAAINLAITQGLERPPVVDVPEGFAARVMAALPARRVRRRVSVGRAAALAALGVLLVALFLLAPHVGPSPASWSYAMEMLLLAQLAAVGYGLVRMHGDTL